MRVAARTVAVELFLPLHHIAFAAVFLDELVHLIAALARAPAAFDAQHIELAFDIAEYEVGSMARAYSITSSARAISVGGISRSIARAVLRLITSSYFTGAWTGRSLGFSPLRMRST
jgi:hypothetical protein